MADDKSNLDARASHAPPPLDPFPTYQSPFPRSSSSVTEENPFIAFRRFADAQISSLLSSVTGLPAIFAQSASSGHWADLEDDMKRRRQQLEEGWRKQWEQEREEGKQEWQRVMKELGPWTPIPDAATMAKESDDAAAQERDRKFSEFISGLKKMAEDIERPFWQARTQEPVEATGERSKQPSGRNETDKCPALSGPGTELDMYEAQFKRAIQRNKDRGSRCKRDGFDKKEREWLGWDGKQKQKNQRQGKVDGNDAEKVDVTTHTFRTTKRFDPISNPDHTLPWLLTSPYSPVYISNPGQPRLARVQLIDEPSVPFRILKPVFAERYQHSVANELAKRLSWADAFEDLVSLEQTGKMVDRDRSTWRTPSTWIHDMVARGSLGPRWGFDEQRRLVKNDLPASLDQASGTMLPCCVDMWPSADAVQEAMKRAKDTQTETDEPKEEISVKISNPSMSSSFWSSSSSSWSSSSSTENSLDTVVSTLTTTERKTLPDGSVETTKVLKKRFADGREESNESVERQNPGAWSPEVPKPISQQATKSSKVLAEVSRFQEDKQTQTNEQAKEPPRVSGWFWR